MNPFPKESSELARYLAGYPEYAVANRYADTPTDPTIVIRPLLDYLVTDPSFLEVIRQAIVTLASNPNYCWMAMYYVADLASEQNRTGAKLVDEVFLTAVREGLLENQNVLQDNLRWVGASVKGGLWGDVLRMNSIIKKYEGITVIPSIG